MPKKKKNAHSPTTLDKAFAISNGYSLSNPVTAEENRKSIRAAAKKLMQSLGIETPNAYAQDTPAKRRLYEKVHDKDQVSDYCNIIRTIMLGYWDVNKVVYRIEPETVRFLNEQFKIEQLSMPFFALIEKVCGKPIFIEMRGHQELLGFFCGVTRLHNKSFRAKPEDENEPKLVISMVKTSNAQIFIYRRPKMLVREYFSNMDEDSGWHEQLAVRLLVYIGFLLCMRDAERDTLIRMSGKSHPYYQVFPIPYKDSLPDFSTPGGWIASGLCNYFGYLNRHTMVREIQEVLRNSEYTPKRPLRLYDSSIDETITEATLAAVLEWEQHKVVFQYDTATKHKLINKYFSSLRYMRMPSDLLAYMPYRTLLLTQSERDFTALVTRHAIHIDGEPKPSEALILVLLNAIEPVIAIMPCDCDEYYSTTPLDITQDDMPSLMCALTHVLQVFKTKAENNAAKAAAHESNACVPTSVHARTPSEERVAPELDDKPSTGIRGGYRIVDEYEEDVVLFDLTPRTVKRAHREDAQKRCGYKMIPHTRRRHPHHYWVGSGDDRHLEVRWLEPMRINASDKGIKTTTIHELL